MPDRQNVVVVEREGARTGLSIVGLLGVLFVALKLIGVDPVAWSWLWVTAPFWGGLALAVAILLVAVVGVVLLELVKHWRRGK